MQLSDFDYHLPEELIAQQPAAERSGARMLVVDRASQRWFDRSFIDLPEYIRPGDCLVLNDTRVFPSRLFGHRENMTGKVEVFLTAPVSGDRLTWSALVRPGRKMRTGERIVFDAALAARILGRGEFGERTLRFECSGEMEPILERIGHTPLPPYIHRPDTPGDRTRYQTVFARHTGSVAAPTAGLHFTPEVLEQVKAAGASTAFVTLHVGLGTFQPIRAENVEQARLHSEHYEMAESQALTIRQAKRVIAAGTTSARTLETVGDPRAASGETDIFIYPGYRFRVVDALFTNFHLPQSSLLMLVCAFAGRELTLAAYEHAVRERYRFFSYGDAMLIV